MSRPFVPSANIANLKESATLAVAAKARALKAAGTPVIDLGAGEPDFDTPKFIRDAAAAAVEAGATRYTAAEGIPQLREAIAADANGLLPAGATPFTAAEVVVSNGSKQSLYNACVVCFGPGDEVLVPTPSWTSYYEMLELARATAVPVFGRAENSLKVTADELAAAATPKTRGVMLNSPCNPTGAVYSRDELTAILNLADKHGWWVIADEIYLRIAYDAPATSVAQLQPARDRLILINGVAKAYAMTGWRIGWAIAPVAVAKAMTAVQSHTTSNPATVSQYAALAALTRLDEANAAVEHMVQAFHRRRDKVLAALGGMAQHVVHPAGAFYLYLDVSSFGGGPVAEAGNRFSEVLLEKHQVAVVPGTAFLTPQWVRASYATADEIAVAGVERIAALLAAGA
jgi:aspartate aminotransferase